MRLTRPVLLLLVLGPGLSCRLTTPLSRPAAAVPSQQTPLPSVSEELKQMKQAGLPTTPEELQAPLPRPEQNAAPLYRQLAELLKTNPTTGDDKIATDGVGGRPLTAENARKLRTAFQHRADIGRLIHQAAERPDCVFDRKWSQGAEMRFPEFATLRVTTRWLSAESALELYDGKPLEAVRTQALGFRVARHAAADPMLIAGLVATVVDSMTLAGMERILYVPSDKPRVSQAVRAAVEAGYQKPSLAHALHGEIVLPLVELEKNRRLSPDAYEKSFKETPQQAGIPTSTPLSSEDRQHWDRFVDRSEVAVLHNLRLLIAAADRPYPEARVTFDKVIVGLDTQQRDAATLPARVVFPVFPKSLRQFAHIEAKRSCVMEAASILAWRAQHGSFPETLAVVLPHVLIDPFNGRPLRYRREAGGFVVYSVGPTGKFDGGTASVRSDSKESFFRYPMPAFRK